MLLRKKRHPILATGFFLVRACFSGVFFLLVVLCFYPFFSPCAQEKANAEWQKDTLSFSVMTYNTENFFDYRHDTLKNDYEFLPSAVRHWDYAKYKKKQDAMVRVILAAAQWNPPALVALCEVENDSVLHHLTRYSPLRNVSYRYLITQSPDERGIDVALLYRPGLFKPIAHQSLGVQPPRRQSRPTRHILHVSGLLLNKDTLDVFVCHFPSRSGGARESEPYRLQAARTLRTAVDSLFHCRRAPQILIMGDLNDHPTNASVQKILQALPPPLPLSASIDRRALYHLLARKAAQEKNFGSYKYQGEWQLIDHIIVSGSLLHPHAPFCTDESRARIFKPPFLLTDDEKYGGLQPFRTYYGMKYIGGYSDHLPVLADFRLIY